MEHKKVHHHRKGEMEHHKKREHHKAAMHARMEAHHSGSHKMIDQRMEHDNHQQGIERVKMRHGELDIGQHGKMGMGHHSSDSFKRSGGGTPRKA